MKIAKTQLEKTTIELDDSQLEKVVGGASNQSNHHQSERRRGIHTINPANGRIDSNR